MAVSRLTKRTVDNASRGERDTYVWDNEVSGFGLKVTPKGRKVYLVQYRLGGRKGRTRRVTIGQHGVFTPDEARTEAKRLLGLVAAGIDPAETRDKAKAEKTVGVLLEQFLVEHADAKLKASTAEEYRRLARLYVLPAFQHRRISYVKRAHVAAFHHGLKDKPYQANRSLALLSKFFNWCEKHGLRADGTNPCRHVEKYKEHRRERFLSEAELASLGQALATAENEKSATPWVIAAIRLLTLTGARRNEILTLRWDHVDMEREQLRLPDSKTGQKSIYLNPPALDVLSSIPRLEGNPYVICGDRPGAHLVNLSKPWRRIRKTAGLDDVRLHDLRHSFASVAVSDGVSLRVTGGLLGHSQPQTTQRYAHLSADPLKQASDATGKKIAAAMSARGNSEKVVSLKPPGRR